MPMGIPSQLATIILREHRHRPITGKLLSIARQTVYLKPDEAVALVERELGRRPNVEPQSLEIDQDTRGAYRGQLITDKAFYSLFADIEYRCLDVTAYEGADIVADLCQPLPPDLEGQFDFIFEGSCLDNIFDAASALRNLSRSLKPGGRIIQLNAASRRHHVYVAYSLSWFHDHYAVNNFEDCQVYLSQWDNLIAGQWDLYRYCPVVERDGQLKYFGQDRYYFPYRHSHAIVIAEKGAASTWDKSPVQFQYRPEVGPLTSDGELPAQDLKPDTANPYLVSALRFYHSVRAPIVAESEKVRLPDNLFHTDPQMPYCGSLPPLPGAKPLTP
jgi:SAM-dependent methyltransferase